MIIVFLLEILNRIKILNQQSISKWLSLKLAAIMNKIRKVKAMNMKVINNKIMEMTQLQTIPK